VGKKKLAEWNVSPCSLVRYYQYGDHAKDFRMLLVTNESL